MESEVNAGEPRVVTRRELLGIRERAWRPLIRDGSLLAEVEDVRAVDTEQALGAYGHLYQRAYGRERESLLRRYPAVHTLATSVVATEHYDHGTFWPALCRLAGIPNDGNTQKEWGSAFIDNLVTLKLPTFEDVSDSGARYVGRILMHSGVPTYCLGDYFRIVSERRRAVPGVDPADFIEWAVGRIRQNRLYHVDKPVQRFLRYGGEFATDVTDRVFELLDIVGSGGSGDDVPLPNRFAEVARKLRDTGELDTRNHGGPGRRAEAQPHLQLDPFGRGPILRLPSVGDTADGTVTWVVALDGNEERYTSTALWPGFNEPAPQVDVPIVRPVRAVSAALPGHEHLPFTLTVIDDTDPLLVFGEDGHAVSKASPLPAAPVWLLFPGPMEEIRAEGDLTVLANGALPPGWSQWSLVLVDLTQVQSVRLADGTRRIVRSGAEARILLSDPVPAIRTLDGERVFAELPVIEIPDLPGTKWSASVQDEQGEVLIRSTLHTSQDARELWAELQRPLAGRLTLKIRGPWGRGASRRFTIIEGLAARTSPSWRRMTGNGLVPAEVELRVPEGFIASPARVELGPRTTTLPLVVDCGPMSMRLGVDVPHMSVSHISDSHVSGPSVTGLQLFTEDLLADAGSLVLDVGRDAEPTVHVLAPDGTTQRLKAKGGTTGQAFRFDLREITDTLAASRTLRLGLDAEGALIIGRIRPRQLFSSVRMEDGQLFFEDCADIEGLTVLCHPILAPWRLPVAAPVKDAVAHLQPSLVDAGPLLITVRIEDPWVPEPMPRWPALGSSRRVEGGGVPIGDDADEHALIQVLANSGEVPESFTSHRHIWDTADRLWALNLGERAAQIQETLGRALLAEPELALRELPASGVTVDRMPPLLIRTGLAWARTEGLIDQSDLPEWSQRNALVLAFLDTWDDADGAPAASAVSVCGEDVVGLLEGRDSHAAAGRFDASSDQLAKLPADVRESILASAAFVPRGLLHQDSRALAAKALLERRDDESLRWLRSNVRRLLREVEAVLASVPFDPGIRALKARRHPTADHGWRVLPAWSIAISTLGRLIAHGHVRAEFMTPSLVRAWESFARIAPEMVTIDLILAELLVRAHRTSGEEAR